MNNAGRIRWIDITKGVAIVSVILGHTFQFGNPVHAFVYSFHIPLFFIVSGYLAKPKRADINKLSKRILYPYLAIGFSTLCLSLIGQSLSWPWAVRLLTTIVWASGGDIEPLGVSGIGLAWFLMAMYVGRLFHSYSLAFFERHGVSEHWRFLYFLGALLLGWGTSKLIILPFAVEQALVASFYMYMGSFIRKLDERIGKSLKVWLCILAMAIWIVCLCSGCFYSIGNLFHVGPLAMGIAMTLCSSYCVMQLCRFLDGILNESKVLRMVAEMGKSSLTILCVHWIESSFIQWNSLAAGIGLFESMVLGLKHVILVLAIYLVIACSFPIDTGNLKHDKRCSEA